jgi:hypothetical protein
MIGDRGNCDLTSLGIAAERLHSANSLREHSMPRITKLSSLASKLQIILDSARKLTPENLQLLALLERANEEIARLLREEARDPAPRSDRAPDL